MQVLGHSIKRPTERVLSREKCHTPHKQACKALPQVVSVLTSLPGDGLVESEVHAFLMHACSGPIRPMAEQNAALPAE